MDMSEFKDQFIEEARSQIDFIDESLGQLKSEISQERLTNLKRGFHTLKGNAATMGYEKYFRLAKAFNDLAECLIEKKFDFNDEVFTLFYDGKDKLLYALDFIVNDKAEEFDDSLTNQVNQFIN